MDLERLREVLYAEASVRAWDALMKALMSAGERREVGLAYVCEHLEARAEAWRRVALWTPVSWEGASGDAGGRVCRALGVERLPMVGLEPGSFLMGSPEGEKKRRQDESLHEVELTRGFLLGRYPVTQALWEEVMGTNPSLFKGARRPVEQVSWFDAVRFCNALSEHHGLDQVYAVGDGQRPAVSVNREADGFRLPTEAEWEYACRAGSTGARHGRRKEIAWYRRNSRDETHDVGQKKPNAWGLHDTLGNVWEWVEDGYDRDFHGASPARDPVSDGSGRDRVVRGGGWGIHGDYLRAAYRYHYPPEVSVNDLGFRCVRLLS